MGGNLINNVEHVNKMAKGILDLLGPAHRHVPEL